MWGMKSYIAGTGSAHTGVAAHAQRLERERQRRAPSRARRPRGRDGRRSGRGARRAAGSRPRPGQRTRGRRPSAADWQPGRTASSGQRPASAAMRRSAGRPAPPCRPAIGPRRSAPRVRRAAGAAARRLGLRVGRRGRGRRVGSVSPMGTDAGSSPASSSSRMRSTRVPRSAESSCAHVQLRDALEAQLAQPVAHERHRATQRAQAGASARASSPMTETHTVAWLQVGRDVHLGDRHETDARVRDLAADDGADLLAQQLVETRGPLAHGGSRLRDARHRLLREALDDVAFVEVVVVGQADAALEARWRPRARRRGSAAAIRSGPSRRACRRGRRARRRARCGRR